MTRNSGFPSAPAGAARTTHLGAMRATRALRAQPETVRLQQETQQQQASLNALRSQMTREKQRRDAAQRPGASRWGSAASTKGSLARYGRDARQRVAAKGPARPRRFSETPVDTWSVADAAAWLHSIDLAQYAETFARNEISGGELLDLGLDDLDYLGVKALAHRKRLLKGVAELCAAHKRGRALPAAAPPDPTFGRGPPAAPVTGPQKQHWSAVPTLREQNPDAPNPHLANACDRAPARLADGGGTFSFGNAEAEVLDEAAERRAFQEAVSAWRSGAPPDLPSPPKCGGSLLEGDYDEQAEQAAFQEAVNAWRTRGEEPAPRRSSPKKLNTVGRTATDVADDLARQLDAMNAEAGAALRQRRQVLEAAAAAARAEGERLRAAVPLVLDDVDSDSESDAAPQSCRVTEVKASDDADEAAYFVDEGSD